MPKKRTQNQLPILQPHAACIAVAAEEIFVAVPPTQNRQKQPGPRGRTRL